MQSSLQCSVINPSENLQNFAWVFEYHYKAKQSSKTKLDKPRDTNIGKRKLRRVDTFV